MTGGQMATPVSERYGLRRTADVPVRLIPVLLCLPLLFMFEYSAFSAQEINPVYRFEVGAGFRLVDVLILGLAGLQLVLAPRARVSLRFPTALAIPLFAAVVAWAMSVAYGFLTGGTQLLYDWRSIVLGVVIAVTTAAGVRDRADFEVVLDALVLFSAGFAVYVLAEFAAGRGVRTGATGRIPLWDQHALTVLAFPPVLAVARWLTHAPHRRLAVVCGAPCFLVVVLASRRNNWGELLIGLALLLLLEGGARRRFQMVGLMGVLLAVAIVTMNPLRVAARIRSMDPRTTASPEAATNTGHVGDLLDAWDVVKSSPILGIGQGKPYRTTRILNWKIESWMVHNAPLHVWVRYGLLGVVAFFWWHVAYFRYLDRLRRRWRAFPDPDARATGALFLAVLAWSLGVFVVGLFFSEWSYSSLQRMVLIGVLWGMTLHRSARQFRTDWRPVVTRVTRPTARGAA